ncbi:MAG: hypothetical protein IJY37_01930 [Clostridia bacterium]|nr:hypothetical protein [Clostridia bacterium]MBQ8419102.1 hypothetical protein [Clostridia bacterium]
MSEKLPLEGKYVMYKGKPLVREKNLICYGNMTEKCYLSMLILTTKTVGKKEVPNNILVQVLTTGPNPKILKQGNKVGLYDAFDIGTIWLERALAE